MFGIGNRRFERRQGCVVDFCPICRRLERFDLSRIGYGSAFYGVPLGEGELITFIICCEQCGVRMPVDAGSYADIKAGRDTDPDRLAKRTFPDVREHYAKRLELEQSISRAPGSLPTEARMRLILEPFESTAWMVEDACAGQVPLDAASGIGCLAAIGIPAALFFAAGFTSSLSVDVQNQLLLASVIVFFLLSAYALVQFGLRPRRYLRRRILPLLARALQPLNPSREEIGTCLRQIAGEAPNMAKQLSADEIMDAMRRHAGCGREGHDSARTQVET